MGSRRFALTSGSGATKAAVVADSPRYAMSNDAYIAYEVAGEGPRDLIVVMEGFIPIDTMEDEPRLARSMARLNSFARLIRLIAAASVCRIRFRRPRRPRSNSGSGTRSRSSMRSDPNARSSWPLQT